MMHEPFQIEQMPRRAFLAWSSALVAGAWRDRSSAAPNAPATAQLPESREGVTNGWLSVGYGTPLTEDRSCLVEAQQLSWGDSEFVRRGARISIFGLEGMTSALIRERVKSLSLDIVYPGMAGSDPLLVHAWHFVNNPVLHASPGNSLVVPVDSESGLRLALEAVDKTGVKRHAACRFTIGSEAGIPKLRRGIYAIAPSDAFAWGGLAWSAGNGPRPRLVHPEDADGTIADACFPGLAMTVDYSDSGAELNA